MKKIFVISFLFLIFGLSIPVFTNAADCPTEGLVPCGTDGCPCQFCHFFILFKNVVNFVLGLVVLIAILMVVYAGIMYFFAGADPGKVKTGNSILVSTFTGLAIVFGAWLIINVFFTFIGVQEFNLANGGWANFGFTIDCPTTK